MKKKTLEASTMTTKKTTTSSALAALLLTAASLPAMAHPGHGLDSGFIGAALHPLTGADHLLATLCAGMLAVHLGGRAGRALPWACLAGMLAGAAFGAGGWVASPMEALLGASVTVLAALLLVPPALGRGLVVAAAATFAAVHGHAHRVEGGMPLISPEMAGLLLASAALVLLGAAGWSLLRRAGLRGMHVALPVAAAGMFLTWRALV
jgi:urease accessory protein